MDYIIMILPTMWKGFGLTLIFFALALIMSPPLGFLMALARISPLMPLRGLIQIYIWIFRGTPLLLQLLFIYFGLPVLGIRLSSETAAVATLVLNYSAYFAEIFRAGIESIDRGQYEAAEVLGLSKYQTTTQIILPQMIKRVLPPTSSEVINLIKDTALTYTIGNIELLRVTRTYAVSDFTMTPFFVAAVFYLGFTAIIQQFFKGLENRYNYYR